MCNPGVGQAKVSHSESYITLAWYQLETNNFITYSHKYVTKSLIWRDLKSQN